jgi:hypothetical protein
MTCPYNNTVKFPDGFIVECVGPLDMDLSTAPLCGQCVNDLNPKTERYADELPERDYYEGD